MDHADLVPVSYNEKTNISPTANSIPTLLSSLQNEYDAIILENFTLKKQLQLSKNELSIALYKQDAAINVAAKALKERDDAKLALEQLSTTLVEEDKLDDIEQAKNDLFAKHKQQKVKLTLDSEILTLQQTEEIQLSHEIEDYTYNIELDVLLGKSGDSLIKYDVYGEELEIINKPSDLYTINNNELIVTSKNTVFNDIDLKSEITSIISHPVLNIFIVSTKNGLILLNKTSVLKKLPYNYKCIALHQDGEILAGYENQNVQIINISTGQHMGSFPTAHQGIRKIQFAPNGYNLIILSTNDTSIIQVIDLRKSTESSRIELEEHVDDFLIDPTSNLLITRNDYCYRIHRFVKKTKSWKKSSEEIKLKYDNINFITNATKYLENNELNLFSLNFDDDKLIKYRIVE